MTARPCLGYREVMHADPPTPPNDATRPPVWHATPEADVLRALDSQATGLGTAQAVERLARYGPNRLDKAARPSAWWRLLRQFSRGLLGV